jgi:hypothetical protein
VTPNGCGLRPRDRAEIFDAPAELSRGFRGAVAPRGALSIDKVSVEFTPLDKSVVYRLEIDAEVVDRKRTPGARLKRRRENPG